MNNRGYATLALLLLLPVVLAALAVAASAYLLMKNDGGSRHACRVTLLHHQEQAAEALKELMALNPQARSLREQRAALERAIELAPDPAEKAALLIQLQMVIGQQMTLAAQQEGLIAKGKMASTTGPRLARNAIKELLVRARSVQVGGKMELDFQASARPGLFDVVADPNDSLTPDYRPAPNFSERQTMQVDWTFTVSALLPEWMRPLANSDNLRVRAACSATLEKRGNKWEAKLKTDKS